MPDEAFKNHAHTQSRHFGEDGRPKGRRRRGGGSPSTFHDMVMLMVVIFMIAIVSTIGFVSRPFPCFIVVMVVECS